MPDRSARRRALAHVPRPHGCTWGGDRLGCSKPKGFGRLEPTFWNLRSVRIPLRQSDCLDPARPSERMRRFLGVGRRVGIKGAKTLTLIFWGRIPPTSGAG